MNAVGGLRTQAAALIRVQPIALQGPGHMGTLAHSFRFLSQAWPFPLLPSGSGSHCCFAHLPTHVEMLDKAVVDAFIFFCLFTKSVPWPCCLNSFWQGSGKLSLSCAVGWEGVVLQGGRC